MVPQYEQERAVTTDAWSAGKSTAGQRALRLAGTEDWAPVYTNAQTLVNASSQAMKKVTPISPPLRCSIEHANNHLRSAKNSLFPSRPLGNCLVSTNAATSRPKPNISLSLYSCL